MTRFSRSADFTTWTLILSVIFDLLSSGFRISALFANPAPVHRLASQARAPFLRRTANAPIAGDPALFRLPSRNSALRRSPMIKTSILVAFVNSPVVLSNYLPGVSFDRSILIAMGSACPVSASWSQASPPFQRARDGAHRYVRCPLVYVVEVIRDLRE